MLVGDVRHEEREPGGACDKGLSQRADQGLLWQQLAWQQTPWQQLDRQHLPWQRLPWLRWRASAHDTGSDLRVDQVGQFDEYRNEADRQGVDIGTEQESDEIEDQGRGCR